MPTETLDQLNTEQQHITKPEAKSVGEVALGAQESHPTTHPLDTLEKEFPSTFNQRRSWADVASGLPVPDEAEDHNPDSLNADDTYAEIYANTPAKALLWETRKSLELAQGLTKDAVLIELVEAYAHIAPEEAYELLGQIQDKRAKIEALAKFGRITLDDLAIDKARELAGNNLGDLTLVGYYARDSQSLSKAFNLTSDVMPLLRIANAGYIPAIEKCKELALKLEDPWGSSFKMRAYNKFKKAAGTSNSLGNVAATIQSIQDRLLRDENQVILGEAKDYIPKAKTEALQVEWQHRFDKLLWVDEWKAKPFNLDPSIITRAINSYTIEGFGWWNAEVNGWKIAQKHFNDLLEERSNVVNPQQVDDVLSHTDLLKKDEGLRVKVSKEDTPHQYSQYLRLKCDLRLIALAKAVKQNALKLYSQEN